MVLAGLVLRMSSARLGDFWRGRRIMLRVAVPAAALMLAGCGGGPPATFDLAAVQNFAGAQNGRGELVVYAPTAALPVDSQRIVIRTGPEAVAYLKGAQWADRVPELVQTRLIESFQNAHVLRAVGRPGLVANYNLQTDVRRFEVDVEHGVARVEISAQIVTAGGASVASKIFTAEAPAANDEAATVTAALNQALATVLRDIVVWAAPKVTKG